jgi:type II secretory pathway pseudopilin PulG
MDKKNKTRNGYAVLELIFYISLFAILSVVVINTMLTMSKSFKETALQAELVQSGTIMERISREIRQAYGIATISASDLVLNTKDNSGANKTVEFLLSGTNLQLLENNILTGNLNTPKIVITALNFTQITTAKGKAVKIFLTVRSSNDMQNRTHDFYDTVVLRGDY